MATTEKIRKDIEKTREKIAEQQKRLRQRYDLSAGRADGDGGKRGCGR